MLHINLRPIGLALMVAAPCAAGIFVSYPSFRSERLALQRENLMWRAKSLAFETAESLQVQRVKGEWTSPTKDMVIDTGITRLPVADEVFAFVEEGGKLTLISVDDKNKVITRTGDVQRILDAYGVRAGFVDMHGVAVGLPGAVLTHDDLKQISSQQQREGSLLIEDEWVTYHEIPKSNLIAVVAAPQKAAQAPIKRRMILTAIIGLIFTIAAGVGASIGQSHKKS